MLSASQNISESTANSISFLNLESCALNFIYLHTHRFKKRTEETKPEIEFENAKFESEMDTKSPYGECLGWLELEMAGELIVNTFSLGDSHCQNYLSNEKCNVFFILIFYQRVCVSQSANRPAFSKRA